MGAVVLGPERAWAGRSPRSVAGPARLESRCPPSTPPPPPTPYRLRCSGACRDGEGEDAPTPALALGGGGERVGGPALPGSEPPASPGGVARQAGGGGESVLCH